ncbi:SGNH/GDSL hydrolase family protein [Leptolyngbya sp. FACHB-261]|uniref:SGNH/GDSL hydrolase family protein n=1 Tax=Leptolyngbya sp. FACHB-261 TaxID=2692806 RepID=UPI001688805B|nr:SGNH/GDSL hydrolase family protein [Leptolyngbya sp. FACHB-261]MBD2100477.1 GDSL family lipase [Leptolyngbya sp. FACHB-261]
MDWYEAEVRALEKSLITVPPQPDVVVFYGSSSIRLWDTLASDFKTIPTLNLGFGGSTLAACVHFFERLVVPCKPRSLVFYAGDNDLGDGQPPEAVANSLRALLQKTTQYLGEIPFAFLAIKPSLARWSLIERIRQTNELSQGELAQRKFSYYIDTFQPMLGDDGQPQPELFAADGLHLSPTGYQVWTQVLYEHQQQIF